MQKKRNAICLYIRLIIIGFFLYYFYYCSIDTNNPFLNALGDKTLISGIGEATIIVLNSFIVDDISNCCNKNCKDFLQETL